MKTCNSARPFGKQPLPDFFNRNEGYNAKRGQLHLGLRVNYRREIINPDGSVAFRSPWRHNLILDSGLDKIGTTGICSCFSAGVIGTGTSPTERDSGATTISVTSGVATASANFFEAQDVGRLLRLDTGEQYYVTNFTDVQNVDVVGAGDAAASEGTIYYVNDTQLDTEHKRTGSYRTGTGDNESTYDGTLERWTHKRTYLFSAEAGPVTIREVGWSDGTGVQTLFGRDVLPGLGDSLLAGQQYVISIELIVSVGPSVQTAVGNVGTGCDTSGDYILAGVGAKVFQTVAASGASGALGGLEPANTLTGGFDQRPKTYWRLSDFTLPSDPTTADVSQSGWTAVNTSKAAYTPGNFFRDTNNVTLDVNTGNGDHYGFAMGSNADSQGANGSLSVIQKFTTPITKLNTQTLSWGWRTSWQRLFS